MRKLAAQMFMTLDGVVQAPGAPEEDREGGFAHGGWLVPFFDEKLGGVVTEWIRPAGGLLLGRKTYNIFADSWPKATDPNDPIATKLNGMPKFVASRTFKTPAWHNSSVLEGDVTQAVAKLKTEGGGELQTHGGGNLLQTLLRSDLVDILRLVVFPVTVGGGKRLFADGALPSSFRLTESFATGTGAIAAVYERTGPLRYGVFEADTGPMLLE